MGYSTMRATKYRDLKGNVIHSDNAIVGRSYMHGSGTVVKEYPKMKPCKSMCGGCRDNFYNGHNPMGVPECWGFKSARVVDKIGHANIHVCNGPGYDHAENAFMLARGEQMTARFYIAINDGFVKSISALTRNALCDAVVEHYGQDEIEFIDTPNGVYVQHVGGPGVGFVRHANQ